MEITEPATNTRDVGTQCCFGITYHATRTIATQTTQTSIPMANDTNTSPTDDYEGLISNYSIHDHTYAAAADSVITTKSISPQKRVNTLSPQKSIQDQDDTSSILSSNLCESDLSDDDEDYRAPQESATSSTEDEEDTNCTCEEYVKEPKFLVFGSSLNELFKFCVNCGASVTDVNFTYTGSLLTVKTSCMNNHDSVWNSQPLINHTPVGNLLICSSILFTGNTFARIKNFASCLGLVFLSQTTFHSNQNKFLFPLINEAWQTEKRNVVLELRNKAAVKITGDGRCDSPGHSAKYGTYSVMDSESGKVVDFNVVQVTEVSSSNAMEREGFVRCVDGLEKNDKIGISCITTDRHVSITSTMAKRYKHIKHQYDVWHLSKTIIKELNKKAKKKAYKDLLPWIQSVSNHLWWSAATCGGDEELLREKWVSILHHVRNKHSWTGSKKFKKCAHPRLNRREIRKKCWLKEGSAAYVALEEVVLKPKLLKDIAKLSDFCHTGSLEVYHSMMQKYCPKRQHFCYKGMVARTQLAAIDNNQNAGRKQAVIQKGERSGEARYNQSFPKRHKKWVVKPVMEKKKYDFLPVLQKKVLEVCQGTEEVSPDAIEVELPDNIASEPAPAKQELIQKHRSRFTR